MLGDRKNCARRNLYQSGRLPVKGLSLSIAGDAGNPAKLSRGAYQGGGHQRARRKRNKEQNQDFGIWKISAQADFEESPRRKSACAGKSFRGGDEAGIFVRADICVSSAVENSPNSVAEGQLLGVPVAASRTGGIPDVVKGGVSGLLFEKGNIHELAACVSRILTDKQLAKELSASERETAAKLLQR